MEKTVILVVGMHRSGTSLLSKILLQLGVDFGDSLLKSDSSNPDGHFENLKLLNINEKVLELSHGSWDAPPAKDNLTQHWKSLSSDVSTFIQEEADKKVLFGIKEPRISLLIEEYVDVISFPCKIIYIKRNCDDVAKSIFKRDGISLEYGRVLCEYYNNEINKSLFKLDCNIFELNFEDLHFNKYLTVESLAKFLGVQTNKNEIEEIIKGIYEKEKLAHEKNKHSRYFLIIKAIYMPHLAFNYLFRRIKRFFLRKQWYTNIIQ